MNNVAQVVVQFKVKKALIDQVDQVILSVYQ